MDTAARAAVNPKSQAKDQIQNTQQSRGIRFLGFAKLATGRVRPTGGLWECGASSRRFCGLPLGFGTWDLGFRA